jgi:hypothetical protein
LVVVLLVVAVHARRWPESVLSEQTLDNVAEVQMFGRMTDEQAAFREGYIKHLLVSFSVNKQLFAALQEIAAWHRTYPEETVVPAEQAAEVCGALSVVAKDGDWYGKHVDEIAEQIRRENPRVMRPRNLHQAAQDAWWQPLRKWQAMKLSPAC